jgi:hypothetical protein
LTRPVRVQYAGAIFAAIVFVLLISFIEIYDSNRFVPLESQVQADDKALPVQRTQDAPTEPDCAAAEEAFAATLDQSRSCRVDSDCSLARFECPFECVTSVSRSIVEDLKREEASFQQACGRCESSCSQSLEKWRAACVRQRCIVMDRSIEELEEATLQRLNQ